MLDKVFLEKLNSNSELSFDEVEKAMYQIASSAENGSNEYIEEFIKIYDLIYDGMPLSIDLLHTINQYFIINAEIKDTLTVDQHARLFLNNVEFYYQMNEFAACARYANMVLENQHISETIRLSTISYLVVLLKNPAMKQEEAHYIAGFREGRKAHYISDDFSMLVYMGMLDARCLDGDLDGYLEYRHEAIEVAESVTDLGILSRFKYHLTILDSILLTKNYESDFIDRLIEVAKSVKRDYKIIDSISEVTIQLCKKLEKYFPEDKIVSFVSFLTGIAPNNVEKLAFLRYLIDELRIPQDRYSSLYLMYFSELKNFNYRVRKHAQLELKNEFLFYGKRKEKEARSFIDELTGLYTRNAYEEMLENCPEELDENLSIIMGDVNFLKYINDTYGHAAGDELLNCLGHIFLDVVSPYGKAYRVGGDEFVGVVTTDKPNDIIKKLNELVDKTVGPGKKPYSISFGLASAKNLVGLDMSELVQLADQRMYKEKSRIHKLKFLNPTA